MLQLRIISAVFCFQTLFYITYAADKYTDENRPYEFGFTIEGEQHRHEKKDENGIIMGEFGFITADGVYHVTVYATDENGRFKIISMKNIRVKPYPTGDVRKGHSLPFAPSGNAPVSQGPIQSKAQLEKTPEPTKKLIASPAKACSHCSLPTTTTIAPQLTDIAVISKDRPAPNAVPNTGFVSQNNPNYQQSQPQSPNYEEQGAFRQQSSDYGQSSLSGFGHQNGPSSSTFGQNNPQYQQPNIPQGRYGGQENYAEQEHNEGQNYPQNSFSSSPNVLQSNTNKNYPQSGDANSNGYQPENVDYPNTHRGNQNSVNQNYPQQESNINLYNPEKEGNSYQKYPLQQSDNNYNNYAQQGQSFEQPQPKSGLSNVPHSEVSGISQSTLRNPKQYNDILSSNSETNQPKDNQPRDFRDIISLSSQTNQPLNNKPTLVAAQMQIVPKDTNIYHKHSDEQDGLPEGLSKDDMTQLLYTFNYSVGFHGHHEEGYRNGAKQGYYYVTGRNGIRTRVDYVADENGFRPRISQEVLELSSDDVPKPETEKDEKFGLKGYEFKWLYFPADDTRNQ